MKFVAKCYFCGKVIDKRIWVETTSPTGFNITVASCPDCAKVIRGQ